MIDILRHRSFFPLKNFEDVERLFEFNIDGENGEPNLALLSIVAGLIEHSLVVISDKDDLVSNSRSVERRKDLHQNRAPTSTRLINSSSSNHHHLSSTSNEHHQQTNNVSNRRNLDDSEFNEAGHLSSCESDQSGSSSPDWSSNDNLQIPEIEFEIVETLYKRFVDQFRGSIDLKDIDPNKVNLKIKKISDSVWEHLSNSYYKDKAHLQNIFSYLTTSKLDCLGLAFAVMAGCQILNLRNIYLALSEDHAWVMFDHRTDDDTAQKERLLKEYVDSNSPVPSCALHGTCEVTWHGKANSDKRGQPVTFKNCWLYTNGYAVKCDVRSCVAALVNSMNPTINSNTDSEILALLQQRLLWLLYHKKIYFPMSLGNLGELEDICATPNAPLAPLDLFHMGIEISKNEYNNSHVYPYTYLASFFFKHGRFKEALETWADASAVMTKYNYSRDDEEIYKEFFEVANELIPSMLKVMTAGGLEPGNVSKKPFLQDPECLALILKFYDNICVWEEGSSTPVLHIGWAKSFVATVLKFSPFIRSKLKPLTEEEWSHNKACIRESEVESSLIDQCSSSECDQSEHKNDDNVKRAEGDAEVGPSNNQAKGGGEALACEGSKRIRLEEESKLAEINLRKRTHSNDDLVDTSESCSSLAGKIKQETDINSTAASPNQRHLDGLAKDRKGKLAKEQEEKRLFVDGENNVTIILRSRKIAGVRDLLHAERLNKTAIELQLTAQSQCAVRGRSNSSSYTTDFISSSMATVGGSTRSKRLHR